MSGRENTSFAINPALDVEELSRAFLARGRLEVRDFLAGNGAAQLREHLLSREDWTLVLNANEKVFELPRARMGELAEAQWKQLDASVATAARYGFQYRYESIRVPDDVDARHRAATPLDAFVEFMSSEPVLRLLRVVTGFEDLGFADGQATSYSAGHFLTRHDDNVEGKGRRAAYVLGLTPAWRAEWGGLLMFHREDGNIEEAFTPAMGALRLFAIPVPHSVSYVVPHAPEARLSVTGWLRRSAEGAQSTA